MKQMKSQRKYRLGTVSNNSWGWRGGGGLEPVLRRANLHAHLPRFTQFTWLFGSHGGLLAHQCVVTVNMKINEKTVMKHRRGLDSNNALGHLDIHRVSATLLKHWSKRRPPAGPWWTKKQTRVQPQPTK